MDSSRRLATAADIFVGALVHKGNGAVAYRVLGTKAETYSDGRESGRTLIAIAKATSKTPSRLVFDQVIGKLTVAE